MSSSSNGNENNGKSMHDEMSTAINISDETASGRLLLKNGTKMPTSPLNNMTMMSSVVVKKRE